MFRDLVSLVPGHQIIAIACMFFFFLVFLGIVFWAIVADRSYINYMKQLPLEKMDNTGEV